MKSATTLPTSSVITKKEKKNRNRAPCFEFDLHPPPTSAALRSLGACSSAIGELAVASLLVRRPPRASGDSMSSPPLFSSLWLYRARKELRRCWRPFFLSLSPPFSISLSSSPSPPFLSFFSLCPSLSCRFMPVWSSMDPYQLVPPADWHGSRFRF